jgi:hypothetical protein
MVRIIWQATFRAFSGIPGADPESMMNILLAGSHYAMPDAKGSGD